MAVEQYPAPGGTNEEFQSVTNTMSAVGDVVNDITGQVARAISGMQQQQLSNISTIPQGYLAAIGGTQKAAGQSVQQVTQQIASSIQGQLSQAGSFAALATPTPTPIPSIGTWYAHAYCYTGITQLPIYYTEQGQFLSQYDYQGATEQDVINLIIRTNPGYVVYPTARKGGSYVGPNNPIAMQACGLSSMPTTTQPSTIPTTQPAAGTPQIVTPQVPGTIQYPPSTTPITSQPTTPIIGQPLPPSTQPQPIIVQPLPPQPLTQPPVTQPIQPLAPIPPGSVPGVIPGGGLGQPVPTVGPPSGFCPPPVVNCNCPNCNAPMTVKIEPNLNVTVRLKRRKSPFPPPIPKEITLHSDGSFDVPISLDAYPDFQEAVTKTLTRAEDIWIEAEPEEVDTGKMIPEVQDFFDTIKLWYT